MDSNMVESPSATLKDKSAQPAQVCTRCIYDRNVPSILFDEKGMCNYCKMHDDLVAQYPTGEEGRKKLEEMAAEIKAAGKNKKYDCVVGVSGGCDSSYLLYKMKELGLRPLAVHFDNTWNSTIATENIHNMLKALDIDLYTIVVDNEEYDDIYTSFLRAGVADIEAPTDIALATTLYKAAAKFGVKYMIEGHSFRTEGVSPLGWLYMDGKYISSVHKQYGKKKMKTYPNLWLTSFLKWMIFSRIKKIRPLYFMDYDKEATKKFLTKEFGWQWYGGHHLENRFTAFYHAYFLPKRFGIDQRVNGYAAMARSGQMTREEGLRLMSEPPHLDDENLEYLKKRLGFSAQEFDRLMNLPKRTYKDFKTYKPFFERFRWFFYIMYKADLVPYSFYVKYTSKKLL